MSRVKTATSEAHARAESVVRIAMWLLAVIHMFPATKHVAQFVHAPSLGEAWKGFGAAGACALYLLPPARAGAFLLSLWRSAPRAIAALGWLLAFVHLVPAADHLPRFLAQPTWADGWRGIGSTLAAAWFVAPVDVQARVVGRARGLLRTLLPGELSAAAAYDSSESAPAAAPRPSGRRAELGESPATRRPR